MSEIRAIKSEEYDFLFEMLYEAVYIPVGKAKPPKSMMTSPLFLNTLGILDEWGIWLLFWFLKMNWLVPFGRESFPEKN